MSVDKVEAVAVVMRRYVNLMQARCAAGLTGDAQVDFSAMATTVQNNTHEVHSHMAALVKESRGKQAIVVNYALAHAVAMTGAAALLVGVMGSFDRNPAIRALTEQHRLALSALNMFDGTLNGILFMLAHYKTLDANAG